MALKFLFDECVATSLVAVAHGRLLEAYHVAHKGLAGTNDKPLLDVLLLEELILVTNNGPDFTALLDTEGAVHPGLVVFGTQVRPSAQEILFRAVLDYLCDRADLINKVIEVDLDDASKAAVKHDERMTEEEWRAVERMMKPEIREYELPEAS